MKLSIKNKLDEKGLTRYELVKRINVTYPTIDNIYKGSTTSIKLEILEELCKVLECTPNDILVSDDPQMNRLLSYSEKINKMVKDDDL